jgi:hypothetical protein
MINRYQRILLDTYCGGEFAHVTGIEYIVDGVGDTLFTFLFNELSTGEDCNDIDTAITRINNAQNQLKELYAALVLDDLEGQK